MTGYTKVYDGDPHTAAGTATGAKGEDLSSLLGLTGTTHTNAGDYPSDPWTFAGNANYKSDSGTTHDQITKANATITVTGYTKVYDGDPHTASVAGAGARSPVTCTPLVL